MRSRFPYRILMKAFFRSPNLIRPVGRGLVRKHLTVDRDYRNPTGEALGPPRQVSVRITNACNHRCAVCGQYGSHGYMKDRDKKEKLLETLPFERHVELVDEMAPHKPVFYYTGGEPFLYPRFPELLNHIKARGMVVSVVTNGVKLEETAETMVENGWDMILVSLDGPEAVHDACRNTPGAFETAMRGIRAVQEAKARRGAARPFVMTSTTLSPVNADHLIETFEIGSALDLDLMIVYLSWFTSEAIGRRHAALLEDRLGVTPFTWQSYVQDFSEEDARRLAGAVTAVRERRWPMDYLIIPNLSEDDTVTYYREPEETFGYQKCAAPFFMVDIMPNGDVVTCRDFIDVCAGNIRETPLLDVWNGERYRAFRRLLVEEGGLLPQCTRCCGLMGF